MAGGEWTHEQLLILLEQNSIAGLVLFVEILFRVRTITFRDISLFKMQNGHPLTHIFSSQQRVSFSR